MQGRTPTAEEKRWLNITKELGCIVCITQRLAAPWETPPEYTANHHIDGAQKPGAHLLSIPLCPHHHQTGPNARHRNKTRFDENFGGEDYLLLMTKDYIKQREKESR